MFIEVKDAKKRYGEGEAAVFALDGVDLSLEKGKICVILGPSGSGKSTLLNMIGGLDSLDSGEIKIDGQNITKLNTHNEAIAEMSDVVVRIKDGRVDSVTENASKKTADEIEL